MKVLELYIGDKWCGDLKGSGVEVISIRLELFDYSIYPKGVFDLVIININKNNIGNNYDEDVMDMEFGLDIITYYDKYYWVVISTNKRVWDNIITWGLPFKDINLMQGDKLYKHRVFNSIDKWDPKGDTIYIKTVFVLLALLQYYEYMCYKTQP